MDDVRLVGQSPRLFALRRAQLDPPPSDLTRIPCKSPATLCCHCNAPFSQQMHPAISRVSYRRAATDKAFSRALYRHDGPKIRGCRYIRCELKLRLSYRSSAGPRLIPPTRRFATDTKSYVYRCGRKFVYVARTVAHRRAQSCALPANNSSR